MNWPGFCLVLFWVSLASVIYGYAGFPLLAAIVGRLFPRPFQTGRHTPPVSIIVAAHNEEANIGEKTHNMLGLDYPAERCELIVASDGSTDESEVIVKAIAQRNPDRAIRLLALPRGGKAAALNTAVAQATGEVLVFTDANSMFAPDALLELLAPLADETVGGVAGDQRYLRHRESQTTPNGPAPTGVTQTGERAFWSFDRFLKQQESRSGNVISATGAIYAIRRSLFVDVPEGVTDDFVTSTRVIEQGKRLVFAPTAAAYEPVAAGGAVEFGRKVRVMTRGWQSVWTMRRLLNPFRYGFYSLQLFSHKVLRRLMVAPLIVLYATNATLVILPVVQNSTAGFFRFAFFAQTSFYLAALLGLTLSSTRLGRLKVLAVPFYFCLAYAAALVALTRFLRGRRVVLWEPQRAG